MKEELYFKDCFTEVEEGKINAEFNKATLKCFDSKNQAFSMDCEGNLVVNSIITREGGNTSLTINDIYPIGAFYFSSVEVDPSQLFGGVWEQVKDTFLLACGDKYPNSSIGGEEKHTLNINELPAHNHALDNSAGSYVRLAYGGDAGYDVVGLNYSWGRVGSSYINTQTIGSNQPHNNMPPYLAVYIWKRVG